MADPRDIKDGQVKSWAEIKSLGLK